MMTSADAWRWVVKGFGGIVGMLQNLHHDPAAGTIPDEWLDDLEKHIAIMTRVASEQRAKVEVKATPDTLSHR